LLGRTVIATPAPNKDSPGAGPTDSGQRARTVVK
jgi:hypothetical protein